MSVRPDNVLGEGPRVLVADDHVFVTMHHEREYVEESIALGAVGFVVKDRLVADLLPAVREVLAGHTFVFPPGSLKRDTPAAYPPFRDPAPRLVELPAIEIEQSAKVQCQQGGSVLVRTSGWRTEVVAPRHTVWRFGLTSLARA